MSMTVLIKKYDYSFVHSDHFRTDGTYVLDMTIEIAFPIYLFSL